MWDHEVPSKINERGGCIVEPHSCSFLLGEESEVKELIFTNTCCMQGALYKNNFFFSICQSEVSWSCPTLCDPMDCNLSGYSDHGIFQAKILEWFAISFSRGSSWPRDQTQVSCIAGRHFTIWATREAHQVTTNVRYFFVLCPYIFMCEMRECL